jgi:molecular chaperone DnaJ
MKDLYEILGVSRDASAEDIKKAYKKLAIQYHPDKNPGNKEAEEKMKDINHAYSTLSDEESKRKYDMGGSDMGHGGFGFGFDPFDIASRMAGFGFGGRRRGQQKGRDIKIELAITLEEIYRGVSKKIRFNHSVGCNTCSGTGGKETNCEVCKGQGVMTQIIDTQMGRMMNQRICGSCNGSGKIITDPCKKCNGIGSEVKSEVIDINIPQGCENGHTFIVKGGGDFMKNGVSGDLYVVISEIPDITTQRQGNDLIKKITLSYIDFIIGNEYILETFDGKIKINIPELSEVGDNLRIKGKGFKRNGLVGDMIIILELTLPKQINEKEKELLTEIKNLKKQL